MSWPSISILIPTLNSARTLDACLSAIVAQRYPNELVEIVVADGGSSDQTRSIAQKYGARVVENPLKTGEAGKAAALAAAHNDLVALIDSDNIIIGEDWLARMVAPFRDDPHVAGAEPLRFVAERSDTLIDRYCAVFGMNDPFCLFVGNYDKMCGATGRWTGWDVPVTEHDRYFTFLLDGTRLPTIGANGTVYRRSALLPIVQHYLNDIDVPAEIGRLDTSARFAKVDVGVRHLFCSGVRAFARKQTRRVRDFFSVRQSAADNARTYPWRAIVPTAAVRFVLSCVTVVPLLYQSVRAYLRTNDAAAFFHPVACWLTLWIYASNFVFLRGKPMSRDAWAQ